MVKSWENGVKSWISFHADVCICLPQPEPDLAENV